VLDLLFKANYIFVFLRSLQLALTVKSLGTQHLHQIEIYKTYPTPYAIDDAQWHTVRGKTSHDDSLPAGEFLIKQQ
jgi:hypothetical protein